MFNTFFGGGGGMGGGGGGGGPKFKVNMGGGGMGGGMGGGGIEEILMGGTCPSLVAFHTKHADLILITAACGLSHTEDILTSLWFAP